MLLSEARDLLQRKDNQTKNISKIQSKVGQLKRDVYDKDQVIDSMINEHFRELKVLL